MKRLLIGMLILLAGCAAPLAQNGSVVGKPYMTQRVQLDEQELQQVCQARAKRAGTHIRNYSLASLARTNMTYSATVRSGCYDWIGGVCVVYTRKSDPLDFRYQQTVGHESLHCELGLFH